MAATVERAICTPRTARCPDAGSYASDLAPCCRGHIRAVVQNVGALLDAHRIAWWIDYGSLLGAVRNPLFGLAPGIIAHDKDADCGVLGADWDRFLAIGAEVRGLGMDWTYKPLWNRGPFGGGESVKVRRSAKNHNCADYFPWFERDGAMYRKAYIGADKFKGREFPVDRLLPLRRIEWEGITVPCPADPEWFVAHRYGPNWRTPVRANNDGVRR